MSNTSRISVYREYEDVIERINESLDEPLTPREAGRYRWLFEQTDDEQVIIDRIKLERSQRRLQKAGRQQTSAKVNKPVKRNKAQPNTSTTLRLKDSGTLVKSAEKLGYKVVQQGKERILLESRADDRLTIAQDSQKRLVVQATQGQHKVHELVRQHTIDRTMEHLQAKGMTVNTEKLANGEVQITAKETRSGNGDSAQISTTIGADGNANVDISNVKGKRCEQIVKDLALSIGGAVSDTKKKDAYFQVVKEPARINL